MANIADSVTELIGSTPLLRLNNIEKQYSLSAQLLAKVECFNPGGSAKDRVGLSLIRDAENRGVLKPGSVIIEPTSGNTGIGLAMAAAVLGYKTILVMPDTMSLERRRLLSAYGAEIVLTPGSDGMNGSVKKARELANSIPNSFIPDQFANSANPAAHYNTTGPEIWRDTDGEIDIFIATIGTGGTLSGTARFLKEQNPAVKTIGIEPASSPLITKGISGAHKIQGIGANFIPDTFDRTVCDEVVTVTDDDACAMAKQIAAAEGILVGISSGAAVSAAIEKAKLPENAGKRIVVLLPDSGERYLSTGIFE